MTSTMIKPVSQIKKIFSEESQVFINDFQNRISELDASLPNFYKQIDGLISTYELLQNSAIKANFYTPKSPFTEIIHHFEESISLLSYQQSDVDWITKGLLFEAVNMMSQIIDEYCFEKELNENWVKLQNNLFDQLMEHLTSRSNKLSNQFPDELSDQSTDELDSVEIKDRTNEPFNLADTSEELHLFDIDFDLDSNDKQSLDEDLTQQYEISDGFLLIQVDSQIDPQIDPKIIPQEQSLMPSNLVQDLSENSDFDIFSGQSFNHHLGNEDETELQGINWGDTEEQINVEDDIDSTLIEFSALNSWGEMDDDDALALAELEAGFDFADDSDTLNLDSFDEALEQNLDINAPTTWESLVSIANSQLDLLTMEPLTQSQLDHGENELIVINDLKDQDFSNLDIDTAIEVSPIYQMSNSNFQSAWDNLSLTTFVGEDNPDSDDNNPNLEDVTKQHTQDKSEGSLKIELDQNLNLEIPNEPSIPQTNQTDNMATIRIPLHHLEKLGDLSEELLVRKGSLDIHLNEIKKLTTDAQESLQSVESNSDSQAAIASLQDTFGRLLNTILNTIERAEQQTFAMSHDVRSLRKNLSQALKQPISSLVSRFPRILREMSLDSGKQVELIVQGAEVEIERSLADVVAEPLDLLIRNAFEYGIESPSDRQQQGKLLQGKIEIITVQTEETTVINVCDDGCGIETTSHIENNSRLSAVRKKFREFGGTISVQSQRGKGTQFTIVLPNTLSLMRVLLIEVDQMCLAIPSNVVQEVVPIAPSHGLSKDEHQENLLWRDRQISIVRLNSLLKLNCQAKNYKPTNAVPALVVIQHENTLFALQVDGFRHDQDASFHQIEGDIVIPQIFLGTVILGTDQAIALVDPSELVNQCWRSLLSYPLSPPLNNSLNNHLSISIDNVIQTSHSYPNNLEDLNSLADFFEVGDFVDPSSFDLSEPLVSIVERGLEPENLESSGLFISNQAKDQSNTERRLSHQPKVLIVESSANIRRYLAMTLARSGFLTEQANNGQDAIALLKKNVKSHPSIDMVITDLEMPQMNGFKLLADIRADADLQYLPVVVLSSHNNENDQQLALELGANAYFSKPYREQELVKTLRQIAI